MFSTTMSKGNAYEDSKDSFKIQQWVCPGTDSSDSNEKVNVTPKAKPTGLGWMKANIDIVGMGECHSKLRRRRMRKHLSEPKDEEKSEMPQKKKRMEPPKLYKKFKEDIDTTNFLQAGQNLIGEETPKDRDGD